MAITAKIVADSINSKGNRLTTFVLTFPRIVLAEFNTHRMISRNSASSRAIPFEKMLNRVVEDPFIPIKWMKDHKGMQGSDFFSEEESFKLTEDWKKLALESSKQAAILSNNNVTKQIVNRLLEPFLWHTVIATATDWENFFALRAHEAAEIHIQDLAYKMLDIYNSNSPKVLNKGNWHIPFGDNINLPATIPIPEGLTLEEGVQLRKVMVATARCARVSYLNFEGKDDYNADMKLFNTLESMGHFSPFEHCAMNIEEDIYVGNFKGWEQLRKTLNNENMTDNRVKQIKYDRKSI